MAQPIPEAVVELVSGEASIVFAKAAHVYRKLGKSDQADQFDALLTWPAQFYD